MQMIENILTYDTMLIQLIIVASTEVLRKKKSDI